jgi:DNA ligase-4
VRSVGIAGRDGTQTQGRLVYIVFDVLMVNNKSMVHLPLSDRIVALQNMIRPRDKAVEVVKRRLVSRREEVIEELDKAISNRDEGIMVKRLDQNYEPGSRDGWYKIKPDYMDGMGDNLDLAIIGGFYGEGTGARSGTLSHFLLGIPAPVMGEGGKVGDKW